MLALSAKAQSDLTIGLIMPSEETNGVQPDAYSLLQSRLENMLTANGVATFGGDFVMYPTVNFLEEKIIEGGIKNFIKVKIDLTLNVVNLSSKTLFSSETWSLAGTAERSKSAAVKNSFSQLRGNDRHFKAFIEKTKSNICAYYETNMNAILSKASSLAATGNHEEAIALLAGYPTQVNGASKAQALLHKVYKQYINNNASVILNEARAAFATKDYEEAVNLASQIDPESSLYNEAKSLINQVRSTINMEQAREYRKEMRELELEADVQKTRINAEASVARAYYNRKVVTYNNIVNYKFVRFY